MTLPIDFEARKPGFERNACLAHINAPGSTFLTYCKQEDILLLVRVDTEWTQAELGAECRPTVAALGSVSYMPEFEFRFDAARMGLQPFQDGTWDENRLSVLEDDVFVLHEHLVKNGRPEGLNNALAVLIAGGIPSQEFNQAVLRIVLGV